MAYTAEQVAALEAAIAQGALEVQYADKRVRYRSLDDMLALLKLMRDSVTPPQATDTPPGRRFSRHDKGLL